MPSGYFLSDGVTDLDAVFEPPSGGNGVSAPGYYRKDNGAVLQYANVSLGSMVASDVGYHLSNDADVRTIWAAKGSVSYLNPTTSFVSYVNTSTTTQTKAPLTSAGTRWNNAHVNGSNSTAHGVYSTNNLIWDPNTTGTYNCNFGDTNPAGVPNKGAYMEVIAHNPTDTLNASLSVAINSDGTWQVIAYGTNGSLDKPTDAAFSNPNPAVVIASGQWLGSTGAGLGAGYTYSAAFSNQKNFSYYAVGPGGTAGNKSYYSWAPSGTNSDYQYVNPGWNSGYSNGPPVWQNGNATGLPVITANNASGSLSSSVSLPFSVSCTASMANAHGNGGSDYETYGEDNWYHRLWAIDLQITINGANGHTLIGQIPLVIGMHWNWSVYGSSGTGGGGGGSGGTCVVLDAEMFDGREAGDFEVGDRILVTNPYGEVGEANSFHALVSYAKPEQAACVEVRTSRGAVLRMSTTAPIPTIKHGFVLAPDLKGKQIAIGHRDDVQSASTAQASNLNVPFFWDEVVEVKDIGMQWVQHLTVDHRHHCFWASSSYEWFVLHHNLKAIQ